MGKLLVYNLVHCTLLMASSRATALSDVRRCNRKNIYDFFEDLTRKRRSMFMITVFFELQKGFFWIRGVFRGRGLKGVNMCPAPSCPHKLKWENNIKNTRKNEAKDRSSPWPILLNVWILGGGRNNYWP